MRGTGTLHFLDYSTGEKRQLQIKGEILVDYETVVQDAYVKAEGEIGNKGLADRRKILMPFKNVLYIEWKSIEE